MKPRFSCKNNNTMKRIIPFVLPVLLTSCTSPALVEAPRFINSIRKDVPFQMEGLRQVDKACYAFEGKQISTPPDCEISEDGNVQVTRTSLWPVPARQPEKDVWRNLYFNTRQHRIVCVDRVLKDGRTRGLVYVLQTESAKWGKNGTYHWDVTDRRNMLSAARILDDYIQQTLRMKRTGILPDAERQHAYNQAVTKADSCYMRKDYTGALRYFNEAFRQEDYIQGQHLFNAACVAALAGDKDAAFGFLDRRMTRDPGWYMRDALADHDLDPLHEDGRWAAFARTMQERKAQKEAAYDLLLRNELLSIGRSDQDIRHQWHLATQRAAPKQVIDSLLHEMRLRDSVNQQRIFQILDTRGWVGKDLVGEACDVFWLVTQHASARQQRKYLPLFRTAVRKGDIPPAHVAMMEDRINMFEGRPQKYGSQLHTGPDGRMQLYPLQDAKKVDEWRKEVGMKPLADYLRAMGVRQQE
ncbi:MAG: tetratricopeptide repeat protein [Prevotella sp.]|nr:tetratricopeptide repeat protein [Prevotella sp.]